MARTSVPPDWRRQHGPDTAKARVVPTGSNSVLVSIPCLCGGEFCSWVKGLHSLDLEPDTFSRLLSPEEIAAEHPALAI